MPKIGAFIKEKQMNNPNRPSRQGTFISSTGECKKWLKRRASSLVSFLTNMKTTYNPQTKFTLDRKTALKINKSLKLAKHGNRNNAGSNILLVLLNESEMNHFKKYFTKYLT